MGDTERFDPVDFYRMQLKDQFRSKAESFIDRLIGESKIDKSLNDQTYSKLEKAKEIDEQMDRKAVGFKTLSYFVLVVAILLGLAVLASIYVWVEHAGNTTIAIVVFSISLVLCIAFFILYFTYFAKRKKYLDNEDQQRQEEIDNLERECRKQLAPLKRLFQWDDFNSIVKATTDMFTIDPVLSAEKFGLLSDHFGYVDEVGEDDSVIGVMSGSINGNPYIRFRAKSMRMLPHVYRGTKTIFWTETETDSDGNTRLVTRSETLVATVTEPAPVYSFQVETIYGNMAAPDLRFSRFPNDVDYANSRALDKFIKRREKELDRLSQEATEQGRVFTPLSNENFDAIWGADDRNNEVQYRLLFTPLAQQNMAEVLKNKDGVGYGDDFQFYKRGKTNLVISQHAQYTDYYDTSFLSDRLSCKELRQDFVDYVSGLFKSIYFDLIPFFAIPLYQMTEAGEYVYTERPAGAVSDYEAMAVANGMPSRYFMPKGSITEQILRVKYQQHVGKSDTFTVTSSAFKGIKHVTEVPMMGGDGHVHQVPVPWIEYLPISKQQNILVRGVDAEERRENIKRKTGNPATFVGGFLGMLISEYNEDDEKNLQKIFDEGVARERNVKNG